MLCNKVFCEFPCLQILYLHGNSIKDIKEIDKLAALASLRKLALHGNLMDSTKVCSNCTYRGTLWSLRFLQNWKQRWERTWMQREQTNPEHWNF